ncbi:hypothetical protein WG906_08750 [Pedobacter sp. P351]|uniref:hypothetical protein n=1 Tax=Pedobacter superstes TaxID=3133441 RepID=UPI0030954262
MKEAWIAVFRDDLTSKVFSVPSDSDDVLFWIKRFENGQMSGVTHQGNTKPLRSFEFYNSKLLPAVLSADILEYKWTCTGVEEIKHDNQGSSCNCTITDPNNVSVKINLSGYFVRDGGNFGWTPFLDENLYFSAVILLLRMLAHFSNWKELALKKPTIFEDITQVNGVPQSIYNYLHKRKEVLSEVHNQTFDKIAHLKIPVDVTDIIQAIKSKANKLHPSDTMKLGPLEDWIVKESLGNQYTFTSLINFREVNQQSKSFRLDADVSIRLIGDLEHDFDVLEVRLF